MTFENELAHINLDRKRSVSQITKNWGTSKLLLSPETPRLEGHRPGRTGSQLIVRLLSSAKELQGRVVGRNKDDACYICKGLEVLNKEWELLEHSLQIAEQTVLQAQNSSSDTVRSLSLSSPDTADSQYLVKQQRRIQQLEGRESTLQDELSHLKAKWETIMAKTMEQQASVHRQQIQQQEALVAQKEAEIEKLRQRLPAGAATHSVLGTREMVPAAPKLPAQQEHFLMAGRMAIGQTLQILGPCDENAPNKLQWYKITSAGSWQPISGATRNQYSPEPADVGHTMGCCITPHNAAEGEVVRVSSKQPVASVPGFEEWVDRLAEEGGASFGVVVVQRNGMLHTNREVCRLQIDSRAVSLHLPNAVVLQQPFKASMQVCGARGAGDAAAQGMFLALKAHEVYMLACETARDRNACILLIRKMAYLQGLSLAGPTDAGFSRS